MDATTISWTYEGHRAKINDPVAKLYGEHVLE